MWAASNMNSAPTSSAISRNGSGVDDAGVGGGAGDDHLRALVLGARSRTWSKSMRSSLGGHAVGDEVVEPAAEVDRRAVGEVAAVVEAQAEDRVARLEQGEVDGDVGVGARVRLHVGVLGAEQRLGPLDWRGPRPRR